MVLFYASRKDVLNFKKDNKLTLLALFSLSITAATFRQSETCRFWSGTSLKVPKQVKALKQRRPGRKPLRTAKLREEIQGEDGSPLTARLPRSSPALRCALQHLQPPETPGSCSSAGPKQFRVLWPKSNPTGVQSMLDLQSTDLKKTGTRRSPRVTHTRDLAHLSGACPRGGTRCKTAACSPKHAMLQLKPNLE